MTDERPAVLSAAQASHMLGLSKSTLAKWRLSGQGPRYSKLGRRVIYELSEISAYLQSNSYASTSEYQDGVRK